MNRTEVIQRFCEIVNNGLSQGKDYGKVAHEQLISAVSEPSQKSLLDQMYQNYCKAQEPDNFLNLRIWEPDERFEQCYELIRLTFGAAEREPRQRYLDMLEYLKEEHHPSPPVIIGRFWHVSGPQQYDASGQLKGFGFDPLIVTDSIMSVISGNYMKLYPPQRQKEGIGAIGHLATRSHFRRGKGHGTVLLQAFEREVEAIAAERGEKLQLIVLEAEEDSWWFWAKQGYRWPAGSRYFQPPLEFDPVTGERLHDEVPELLMVKIWNNSSASQIDSKLLIDTVRTMYQNWCLAKIVTYSFSKEAVQRATDYVMGKIFTDFLASLPPGGESVPLQEPPSS